MYKTKPITKARIARAVLRKLEYNHWKTELNYFTAGDDPDKAEELNNRLSYLRSHIIEVLHLMVINKWVMQRPQNVEIRGRRLAIIKSIQRYYQKCYEECL